MPLFLKEASLLGFVDVNSMFAKNGRHAGVRINVLFELLGNCGLGGSRNGGDGEGCEIEGGSEVALQGEAEVRLGERKMVAERIVVVGGCSVGFGFFATMIRAVELRNEVIRHRSCKGFVEFFGIC